VFANSAHSPGNAEQFSQNDAKPAMGEVLVNNSAAADKKDKTPMQADPIWKVARHDEDSC